jgi:hypothetical protein
MFMDIIECSSKLFHSFSMCNNLNKKGQHRKLKRLNKSILNLFPRHHQTKNTNQQIQQQNSFLHPPTSELSRSISKKSITFASVFDELENENNDLSKSIENEDLVIVVLNKYVNNESTLNLESYPFRSEIPSYSLKTIQSIDRSNSAPNLLFSSTTNEHHRSFKTIRHWFRFIQSFIKHPKSHVKSTTSQKYPDLIY